MLFSASIDAPDAQVCIHCSEIVMEVQVQNYTVPVVNVLVLPPFTIMFKTSSTALINVQC